MGIATAPLIASILSQQLNRHTTNSMLQDYHQAHGIFGYSNTFERSAESHQQHLEQQIRKDKLRAQGYEQPPPPLVRIEEEESSTLPGYETGGMLSEMFNCPSGVAPPASTELLDYRAHRPTPGNTNEYRQDVVGELGELGESKGYINRDSLADQQQQLPSINADSAAAMHLILMNPHQRSPSLSPPPTTASTSNTLHMLLPNPSTSLQGFNVSGPGGAYVTNTVLSPPQFTWTHEGCVVENQGNSLSLSLSSSLQHLEAAKVEELRMGDGGLMYYNQFRNLGNHDQDQHQNQTIHLQGGVGQSNHVGFESSSGMVIVLSNSKYIKAAQELLEEFCSVGRSGQLKKNKLGRIEQVRSKNKYINTNPNSNPGSGGCSSSIKDLDPLSASDRIEHQRKKVKLLSMLDQVEWRYNHYCEQMQMVVNSFDLVMGYGAAVPYTALAQKAMSRHLRCLKDAISAQLRHSCEMLGERDGAGSSGITKGETPRLRVLEQSLRQQRVFHQMGMMEQEAWRRPQRGLPGRSVNILRAWLFDHFLNPYPSDADKHLLARQTGLSRNQVSNWFINARVRLWKPMVEDMYQQETRIRAQTSTPTTTAGKRYQINATENDPSINTTQCFSGNQTKQCNTNPTEVAPPISQPTTTHDSDNHQRIAGIEDTCHRGSVSAADYRTTSTCDIDSTVVMLGTTTGDVSLTLGLRHAGNMPQNI